MEITLFVEEEETGECSKDLKKELTINFDAPLLEAQVLMLFLDKECWSFDDLKAVLEIETEQEVEKRLGYWINNGVLYKSGLDVYLTETYSLIKTRKQFERLEELVRLSKTLLSHIQDSCFQIKEKLEEEEEIEDSDDEDDENEEIPFETQVEHLEMYWPYTKNLLMFQSEHLTNARIAAMYKMFASPGKPGPTIEAVTMFMQKKIKQNLVVYENGVYKPTKELKQ